MLYVAIYIYISNILYIAMSQGSDPTPSPPSPPSPPFSAQLQTDIVQPPGLVTSPSTRTLSATGPTRDGRSRRGQALALVVEHRLVGRAGRAGGPLLGVLENWCGNCERDGRVLDGNRGLR